MRITLEEKERQYRVIYEDIFKTPRIPVYEIASRLQIGRNAASNRLNEVFNLGYASKPQIRKRSFPNMKEYLYFLNCKKPAEMFPKCLQNDNIIYHAVMSGFSNLWVVSRKKIDFDCDVFVEGLRSDYHVSYAPNHSWETAFQRMRKKVENFNPKDYSPEGIIKTHWNEFIEWDSEDEKLFLEFNYDLRKPVSPIMKNNLISWGKVEKWFKKLPECCTIITRYFPKRISAYDPYLFVFQTNYEDFIIDLFSELPTSSIFFKVSDRLFMVARVRKEYLRAVDSQVDIRELQIPSLAMELCDKGVIHSEAHALVECYWNKDP
ncbi:MAG: hypothetical protein HXS48_01870 [Theionarchaea archaeon]|nr:hypothetical protein [Theionarchaea archaeon]